MSPTRPEPRDLPSLEETAALHAELRRTVAERRRICGADLIVRGRGSRRAWVSLEGTSAWLAITEHGAVLAESLFDASVLLDRLGESPSFDDLYAIAGPESARGEATHQGQVSPVE